MKYAIASFRGTAKVLLFLLAIKEQEDKDVAEMLNKGTKILYAK